MLQDSEERRWEEDDRSLTSTPGRCSFLATGALPRCQAEPRLYVCLGKTGRMGGFQKFVGYGLLSVACFLHPVLVWHVTIPGTMLIVTGMAYLLLSKRKKFDKEFITQAECYSDPSRTAIEMTRAGDTEQTYTFNSNLKAKKDSLLTQMRSILTVKRNHQCPQKVDSDKGHLHNPTDITKKKQVHFEENVINIIPAENGMVEDQESEQEETVSDTAPIIPTEPKQLLNNLPVTTGLF
ncbi:transmembrane protein 72 isoform X2 [Xenopus tropicalis]|uniref:Transmembrane protein 72 isoform X2 n=1 Tax=Xenopus tropicalis TaxID=8364 RepID=A0A8J1JY31_XENTR|nr:transmembrane protein 72 isoform X2 [Xenopus tropicalis]